MTTQLKVTVGADRYWGVQCWLDGGLTPAAFGTSDTLTAYVYQGQDQSQLFSLSVVPYTDNGGTGYAGGQLKLGIAGSDSSTLDQNGEYPVIAWWTPRGSSQQFAVWRGTLLAEPAAGSAVQATPTYCSLADVLEYAPWIRTIQDEGTDQEGFYTQRLEARQWLDWLIVKAWRGGAWGVFGDASRPASEWSGWGMWRTPLPSPYLMQMLSGGYVPANGAVTLSAAGTGYSSPPVVSVPAPTGTTTPTLNQSAAFSASLNGTGGVGAVVVTVPGSGYTPGSTLTLTFTGGGGTGAAGTAKVSTGALMIRDQVRRLTAFKTIAIIGAAQIGISNQYANYAQYFADRVSEEWQQYVAELDINGDGLADLAVPLGRTNTIYE